MPNVILGCEDGMCCSSMACPEITELLLLMRYFVRALLGRSHGNLDSNRPQSEHLYIMPKFYSNRNRI